MSSDFALFWKWAFDNLWRLYLPSIENWNDHPKVWPEARAEGAAGLFDPNTNTIYLRPEYLRNWGLIAHEYGHWLFYRIHLWLDAAWEIPWWALSGRRLFLGKLR